jgi:hypothetical protein
MDDFELKPQFKSGSEVLQKLFEDGKSPLSEQFLRWKIWARWPDYVGVSLAKECEPVGYFRGTLYLWVRSSSSMHNLNFLKDQIQAEINKKLERTFVQKIRLTLDRKEVPTDAQEQKDLRNYVLQNKGFAK